MVTELNHKEYRLLQITRVAAEVIGEPELTDKIYNYRTELEGEGFTRLGVIDTGKLMYISWLYAR